MPDIPKAGAANSKAAAQTQQVPPLVATFQAGGNLTVRTGSLKFIVPTGNYTIGEVRAVVNTANTGSSVIVDVKKNGTTIYSGGTGRPTIPVSTANTPVTDGTPSTTTVAAGDLLSVDIAQIGSTLPGADLTVEIELIRTS